MTTDETSKKLQISKRLQDLRIANGYTQKQLAGKLGIKNYSTISSWEIGKSEPSLSMFSKLCEIYNITDIAEIFPELKKEAPADETSAEALISTIEALIGEDVTPEDMELLFAAIKSIQSRKK